MHQDLLRHSPLLVLPIAAMLLFLAVWVLAAIRAMTQSRQETAALACLPLKEDASNERR